MSSMRRLLSRFTIVIAATMLVACSNNGAGEQKPAQPEPARETIWSLFEGKADQQTAVSVNKYIWQATFEVLDFLPVETADPFTGVFVTGWGQAPGSDRSYKATVLVSDPALEIRALRVSLLTPDGPADEATVNAVEDAILTRARQIRVAATR